MTSLRHLRGPGSFWLAAALSAAGGTVSGQDAPVGETRPGPAPIVFQGTPNPPFVTDPPPAAPIAEDPPVVPDDTAIRLRFFAAIADNNKHTLVEMLNGGMDPNAELPFPAPADFQKRFADSRLAYYVAKEPGFTALMMATALGNNDFVRFLLMAGADPLRKTKRHKTHALWLAGTANRIDIMRSLLGISPEHEASRYRIHIDLTRQRATLWRDGHPEWETPISSGRKSHPTPTGQYLVTDKHRMWKSTLYDAKMPFYLRLSCGDFGLHQGVLPGYPASHGCIRLPEKAARKLFATVPIGTLVEIE